MRANEHPTRERHDLRRLVAVLALAVCVLVAAEVGVAAGATSPGIDLRLDFETGDGSQFSGLECPHAGTQFEVYDASAKEHPAPRQGRYAARFSETPLDVWPGNDIVRCLGAHYDSGESAGDDFYYALSVFVPPAGLSNNLIWELHHPSSLYKLASCGVAPLALHARDGGLDFRIVTGNCTVGTGNAYREPNLVLPGLERLPRSTWLDIVVHVVFSESDGRVEVWHRTGAGEFPALPQLARYGIPTLPWSDGAGVHDVTLYTELGLYAGRAGYADSDSVYLDGYRRGTSMDAVLAEFPGAAAAPVEPPSAPPAAAAEPGPPGSVEPPVISGEPVVGQALTASTGTWSNEPTGYAYQWQWSTDRRSTWRNVSGATQQAFDVTATFVDAEVRVIVTATNASGSASAASEPVTGVAATVAAPRALVAPIVSGVPIEGETLAASSGVWSEPAAVAYQWQWSRDGGATWVDVRGATRSNFDVTATFVGAKVRVVVTGFNDKGASIVASEPVSPVGEWRGGICRRTWG